eukprot:gene15803-21926_t
MPRRIMHPTPREPLVNMPAVGWQEFISQVPADALAFHQSSFNASELRRILATSWVIGVGDTSHITGNEVLLFHITTLDDPVSIRTASPHPLMGTRSGTAYIKGDHGLIITLNNMLLSPGRPTPSLLSVNLAYQANYQLSTTFNHYKAELFMKGRGAWNQVNLNAPKVNRLYLVSTYIPQVTPPVIPINPGRLLALSTVLRNTPQTTVLWHERYGHLSYSGMHDMILFDLTPAHFNWKDIYMLM